MRSLSRLSSKLLALGSLLILSPTAYAEESGEVQNEALSSESSTLSISPIHLLSPIIELTYESTLGASLGAPVSFALIGGVGTIQVGDVPVSVWELGLQLRGYLNDPFEGLHYGVELIQLGISAENGAGVSGSGAGLVVGPFLGWKAILDSGLTFELQGGYQALFASVEASDSESGQSEEASGTEGVLLLNINVGWSF